LSSTPPRDASRFRRTLVVGDVHGCLSELDDLLRTACYERGRDRLVFTGDLLDRGPESLGVLRRARELEAESVLGNHEQRHLLEAALRRSVGHGERGDHLGLTDDDLGWLARLPRWLRIDARWVVVHAGLEPGTAVEQQRSDVMQRIRFIDASGRWAHLNEDGVAPPGSRYWASAWDGLESVTYGHHIHDLATPRIDEARAPGAVCLGLDTGCCVGGRLTAVILPSLEFVQVRSRSPLRPFRPKD
jgi:hypothetical protein